LFEIGDKVWFHAPHNVDQQNHGLNQGDVVAAAVSATNVQGPEWYEVDYDEVFSNPEGLYTVAPTSVDSVPVFQRTISAHRDELTERQ